MDEEVGLRDCAWCGMPMSIVSRYTMKVPAVVSKVNRDGEKLILRPPHEEEMVQASCPMNHWYGGPLDDIRSGG